MYKILTKNEDVNGKVYYLRQTYCFSLSEAKMFIKKKGNRKWHYVIEHDGNITHECKPNCFSAREIIQNV
jgi:hypothetical protein